MTTSAPPRHPGRSLPISTMHGEVHRFRGVVDRFGKFTQGNETVQTLCIRDICLADTNQKITPDHWWFRLREVWITAGVRVGDTLLFTVKVQHAAKGWADPGGPTSSPRGSRRPREQVVGFGVTPRAVVILHRRQTTSRLVDEVVAEKGRVASRLEETEAELLRLQEHRQALLEQTDRLQQNLQHSKQSLQEERQARGSLERRTSQLRRHAVLASLLALTAGGGGGLVIGQRLPDPAPTVSTALVAPQSPFR